MSAGRFTTANLMIEYNEKLKSIAALTGDTVSGLLNRVIGDYITNYEAKNGEKIAALEALDKQRSELIESLKKVA